MVICVPIDYSSLPTCYHGNIAMQMAVDYIELPAYSNAPGAHTYTRTQTEACADRYLPTLHIRSEIYTICIGYVICD